MVKCSSKKWLQAKDRILEWIVEGDYESGQKLPSERELAGLLSMNHRTVRRGLEVLVSDGLVEKKPRVGNFVGELQTRDLMPLLIAFPDYMLHGVFGGSDNKGKNNFVGHPSPMLAFNGISSAIDPLRYSCFVRYYRENCFAIDIKQFVLSNDIKGVLIWSTKDIKAQEIRDLQAKGVCVAWLNCEEHLRHLGLVWVNHESQYALAQCFDKFAELGHKRIAYVRYTRVSSEYENSQILKYYKSLFHNKDIEIFTLDIPNKTVPLDFSYIEGFFAETRPTAIICHDEYIASEFFRLIYSRGMRVPEDVSIAALADNSPHMHIKQLSAPDTPRLHFTSAYEVTKKLISMIEGNETLVSEIHLRGDMVWKESVGKHLSSS